MSPLITLSRRQVCWLFLSLLAWGPAVGVGADAPTAPGPTVPLPDVNVSAHLPLMKIADFKMRKARFAPAAVTDGRYIYIIGGQDSGGGLLRSVERFDPRTGISEPFAELHKGRLWHQAVMYAGRIYVLGGSCEALKPASSGYRDLLRASPEVKAMARVNETGTGTGIGLSLDASVEVIDLATRQVTSGADLPEPRNQFGCVTVGDDLYVLGGRREIHGQYSFTNTVRIYSFATSQWRDGVPMPTPRGAPAVVVDGPFIVVTGGFDGTLSLNTVEAFNPRTSTWTVPPVLCRHLSAHSAAYLGHYLFLFGNYDAPEEVVAYDLLAKQSEAFTLQYKASRHTAIATVDGKIYVIGGKEDKSYDPVDYIQVFTLPPKKL